MQSKAVFSRWLYTLAAITFGLGLGPTIAEGQSRAEGMTTGSAAPLEPGDQISLHFWRDPGMSGEYPVDEAGSVALPYLGYRSVSTLPPADLKARLVSEYGDYLADQAVQIILLRRITILGAVQSPGLYHVDPTMSVQDALALAGGVGPQGRPSSVQLRRGGQVLAIASADASTPGVLASGDQLYVPERGWFDRNAGVVIGAGISALGFVLGQALF